MSIFPYELLERTIQTYLREAEKYVNLQVY